MRFDEHFAMRKPIGTKLKDYIRSNGFSKVSFCMKTEISRTTLDKIISDDVLCELVLHSIQRMAKHIIADEKAFAMELRKRWQEQVASKPQEQKEELSRAKRRLEELDRLIGGLYENYMTGTLPEKQYRSLMKRYSDEQAELDKAWSMRSGSRPCSSDRFQALFRRQAAALPACRRLLHRTFCHHHGKPQQTSRQQAECCGDDIPSQKPAPVPSESVQW